MCVSALILSKGIHFSNAGLAEVVMRGRYSGITLPNPRSRLFLIKQNNTILRAFQIFLCVILILEWFWELLPNK